MTIRAAGSLLGIALAIAACTEDKNGRYPVAPQEALSRLEKADIIGFRNARQCGMLIYFSRLYPDDHSIGWMVTIDNEELVRFSVSLSQAGTGTKTTIVVPKAANGGEMYDGTQAYEHPALFQPLRPAVQELIDSAMDQRPFDSRRLPDPLNAGPNDTISNCTNSRASLERGNPWRLEDPPGMSHEDAVRFGLAH